MFAFLKMKNNKMATKLKSLPFDVYYSAYKCIFLCFESCLSRVNAVFFLKSLFKIRCLECMMCDLGMLHH